MRVILLSLLVFLFACGTSRSIGGDIAEPKALTQDTFLLDAIGQVYSWTPTGQLEKVRSANQLAGADTLRYRYHNVRLGALHSIDVTNPLRPVLFYRDAQTVVWLERNLTELRQLNLLDRGLNAVDAVAYAPNDGLWLYAPDKQQLLLLDLNGEEVHHSVELSQTFNTSIRALEIVATPRQVAMATTDGRMLLFGPFAGYSTQVLRPARHLTATGDRILFQEGEDWYKYSSTNTQIERISLPQNSARLLAIRGENLLWQNEQGWYLEKATF